MRVSSTVNPDFYDDSLYFGIDPPASSGRRLQIVEEQLEDECSNGRLLFAFVFLLLAAFCALMAFQVNKAKKESQMKSLAKGARRRAFRRWRCHVLPLTNACLLSFLRPNRKHGRR